MKTEPYTLVKANRDQYQVLDKDGRSLCYNWVSLPEAKQTIVAHKLQDKALSDERLLKIVESVTSLTGDWCRNWLYEVLIRTDIPDMRAFIKKPSVFRAKAIEIHKQNVEARLNSIKNV